MPSEMRTPTETTEPIVNDTAGLWTFVPPASVISVHNNSGQPVYARFNSASAASATPGAYDDVWASGTAAAALRNHYRASDFGLDKFETVSVWFPTGATVANFNMRGN